MHIPPGYFGQIIIRSSLAVAGLSIQGGVIDSGYEDEIKIILVNLNRDKPIRIHAYDRIAQIIIKPIWMGKMIEATSPIPGTSSRGKGGFGSTGVYAIKPTKKKITEFEDGKGPEDKFAYKIGSHLSQQETSKIHVLMHQYKDILAISYEDIQGQGSISQHQHDIDIGDSKPIKQRPYPLPFHMKAWVE
jgi:dUTPase